MSEQIEPKQKEFILKVIRSLLPQAEVLAFGSRIAGHAAKYSDLDLALKEDAPIALESMDKIREILAQSEIPFLVDLMDYTELAPDFRELVDQSCVRW